MGENVPYPLQWRWRELLDRLHDHEGDDWAGQVVVPWLERNHAVVSELHRVGAAESHQVKVVERRPHFTALEGLYALSRIVDVLIAPFQPLRDDPKPGWTARLPNQGTLLALAVSAGWTMIDEERFHPFFHEIVAVVPAADPDSPAELVSTVWPGYFVGSLLIVRAGVTVSAGRNVLDPEVAARSCLYWAWWRRSRVTRDQAHGCDSGSQWATDFRRDYLVDGWLHYNVDARHRPRVGEVGLDPISARDLLRYRCSIREDLGEHHWPYAEHLVEPAPGALRHS